MKSKEEEYKELFLAEALENFEEINRLLTVLEKNSQDENTIHALFRITHTLKGNAAGMGFTPIAELAHVLEDLFGEVRDGKITLNAEIFSAVYKGADILGECINAIRDGSDVRYKGIKTKLEVLIKRQGAKQASKDTDTASKPAPIPEATTTPEENPQPEATETGAASDIPTPEGTAKEATVAATASESEEATVEKEPAETGKSGEPDTKISFSDLVQVPVRKLDNLLNLVGELIIEKDRILASHTGLHASNEYARLSRISSDLQYSVMDVRLVQVGFLFNKFHRVVRDAASIEKKKVALRLEGTETEIDRNILQVISDSLIHLIRNAVGHGVETPEERLKNGKPEEGTIMLTAYNESDAVVIEIKDDGKGLNIDRIKKKAIARGLITLEDANRLPSEEISMLIFEPGFSTMDEVTAISGRGVGMDVVKKTLDTIGGSVRLTSMPGEGTLIQLTLPSSMAVKSCLLFELNNEVYAIPLVYTESVISLYKSDIHKVGEGLVGSTQNKNITILFLKDLFNMNPDEERINMLHHTFDTTHPEAKIEIVVVSFGGRTVGLVVDKLLQQKEIVEKPLTRPVERIRFISGVTILGSGNVCLVLNIPSILNFVFHFSQPGRTNKKLTLN